jgi:hypothetical protein
VGVATDTDANKDCCCCALLLLLQLSAAWQPLPVLVLLLLRGLTDGVGCLLGVASAGAAAAAGCFGLALLVVVM